MHCPVAVMFLIARNCKGQRFFCCFPVYIQEEWELCMGKRSMSCTVTDCAFCLLANSLDMHVPQIDMIPILWGLGSNTAATASQTDSPDGGSVAFHVPQPVGAF